VNLPVNEFRRVLEVCGCAMIGQTAEIAPADRKLYALRDVTGTVESPYLICASIMSKKLAEGIDALVLDVKTGSGAFMKNEKDAAFLAQLMVETGERMGKQVVALITDMDQPLGKMIGNSLEVVEVIEILRGGGPEDLRELCLHLAGWMLYLGGVCQSVAEGNQISAELISSGKALDRFRQMVELQGGDVRSVDDTKRLPQAQHTAEVLSSRVGHVSSMQCEQIGTASAASAVYRRERRHKSRLHGLDAMRADRNRLRHSRRRPRAQGRFRRSFGWNRLAQESRRSRRCERTGCNHLLQFRSEGRAGAQADQRKHRH
jgi:pyrimidine-nucleoside phosphorylase